MSALPQVYASETENPFDLVAIGHRELRRDPHYARLTPEQRSTCIIGAIRLGRRCAARFAGQDPEVLSASFGLVVEERSGGNMVAGAELFAEYDSGSRTIRLFPAGISKLAARLRPGAPELARELARALLIAHELFHHLEATDRGAAHLRMPHARVPFCGGRLTRSVRLRSTREVAAHSFAHTLLGLSEPHERG